MAFLLILQIPMRNLGLLSFNATLQRRLVCQHQINNLCLDGVCKVALSFLSRDSLTHYFAFIVVCGGRVPLGICKFELPKLLSRKNIFLQN